MIKAGDIMQGDAASHLVVKRGHHGRFRFVLIQDGEKIAGAIHIKEPQTDKSGLYALALGRIAELAEALRIRVTTASGAGTRVEGVPSDRCGRTTDEEHHFG